MAYSQSPHLAAGHGGITPIVYRAFEHVKFMLVAAQLLERQRFATTGTYWSPRRCVRKSHILSRTSVKPESLVAFQEFAQDARELPLVGIVRLFPEVAVTNRYSE
jgi:hypothetical protein